ncbi:hypothetical protein L2735_08725 [Shewanella olleyana]|uniref:hypothetical protein n=1 Tax=Shewanella olleyana TaxID=135626 RepID=UPI00200BBCF9|nr:hypothetical protein [Shewanella olleyana]MCL1066888.1 hypothetical protein [Shewanella olleyana]
MPELEACTTWECVNSFAAWFAAIATIIISSLALWLSVKDRMVRLEATFWNSLVAYNNPTIPDTWFYALTCVNLGYRPVTITNYHWKLFQFPFTKKTKIVTNGHKFIEAAQLSTKLPADLADGKQAVFYLPSTFFEQLDRSDEFIFCRSNKLLAFWRIYTFNVYVDTSVSKVIKAKMSLKMRRNIWSKYLNITSR